MKKILAVLLALSFILCCFAACGEKADEPTTEAPSVTESSGLEVVDPTEAAPDDATEAASADVASTEAASADATEAASAADTSTTAAASDAATTAAPKAADKVPSTKAEILAAYTKVMDQAKKDAPGFTKIEYQVLPEDAASRVVSEGGSLVGTALKVAANFMTTEADAKKDPEIKSKGNDMHSWPVCNTPKGCMLTDVNFIKSAKCEVLSNGNYKITIVTNPESNPEPAPSGATTSPSKTGAMFGTVSKKDIDDTLSGGIVSAVFKDVNYSLVFHDCTAVLVYNPKTNRVVSLDQTTHTTIKGSGKALGLKLGVEKQELIDYMKIYNIAY